MSLPEAKIIIAAHQVDPKRNIDRRIVVENGSVRHWTTGQKETTFVKRDLQPEEHVIFDRAETVLKEKYETSAWGVKHTSDVDMVVEATSSSGDTQRSFTNIRAENFSRETGYQAILINEVIHLVNDPENRTVDAGTPPERLSTSRPKLKLREPRTQ